MLRFSVLGPLLVQVDGRPVELPTAMLRRLVAILLTQPGQPMPIDLLLEALWEGQPPPTARKTLQIYVHRLRRALGEAQVPRGPTGYWIALENTELDSLLFTELARQAGQAADRHELAEASRIYAKAVELWRGNAFADIVGCGHVAAHARQLDEARLHCLDRYAEAELRLGRHSEVIGWLTTAASANPYLEKLREHLILALYRSGRQADALAEYRQLHRQLVEELGVEPGPELQQLHDRMLRNDPELTTEARAAPVVAPLHTVPAQLPLVPRGFTGRSAELDELQRILESGDADPVTVVVLTGTAGVGKTSTALYWGRRIAHRFPDGQLYANLRGFDPSGAAVESTDVLRAFLGALGVTDGMIPADVEAQAALFRSQIASRRMLIVLDNVFDAAHVRPLLPGTGQSLALLTSRSPLTGLVAATGAHPLALGLLTDAEAWQLLAVRLGHGRLTAEPEAVHRIVRLCAGLPLALAVITARALTRPNATLASLADDLSDSSAALDALSGDDPLVDVRAVFSWSYDALSPLAASVFRLWAVHPGPDIAVETVADLARLSLAQANAALAELVKAHLFAETATRRYATHDLLRAYATELIAGLSQREIAEARKRLLDHYVHAAKDAANALHRSRLPIPMPPRPADLIGTTFSSPDEARAWLSAEFSAVRALMEWAGEEGFEDYVWQMGWAISDFAIRQSRWKELREIGEASVAAASKTGSPHGLGIGYRCLSLVAQFQGSLKEAEDWAGQALEVLEGAGLLAEAAIVHIDCSAFFEEADLQRAQYYAHRALELSQRCGYEMGEVIALNSIAMCAIHSGDYEKALEMAVEATARFRKLNNIYSIAAAISTVGQAQHGLGRLAEAIEAYEEAIALYRKVGRLPYVAGNLVAVGDVYRDAGLMHEAGKAWHEALAIHRDLGQIDEELVDRVRLLPRGAGQS